MTAAALGSSETDAFIRKVKASRNQDELSNVLQNAPESIRKDRCFAWAYDRPEDQNWRDRASLISQLRAMSAMESVRTEGRVSQPQKTAQEILSNPLYRDAGPGQQSNWLSRIGERIGNWLERLLRRRGPTPRLDYGLARLEWLKYVVWCLLGVGALVFLVFFVRQFNWKFERRRRRRVGGLLDDDEPERTADEWLLQADGLTRDGKYREAVRCLYLACLVRLDEANVARFIRSQTNWEHLARIESSPRRPEGLGFRGPTQAFDRIWYGRVTEGAPDVERFRTAYTSLCESIERSKSPTNQAI